MMTSSVTTHVSGKRETRYLHSYSCVLATLILYMYVNLGDCEGVPQMESAIHVRIRECHHVLIPMAVFATEGEVNRD